MDINRREFIKKGAFAALGLVAGAAVPVITSCTKHGIDPFTTVRIHEATCVGCGECLEACFYDAILLPQRTQYTIDVAECIDCGQCVPYCKYDAIDISIVTYQFNSESCVGCGDCIKQCVTEGNCITYQKEDYTVKGKCQASRCRIECAAACLYDAISIVDGRAVISMDKCIRCGDCIPACPFEAINPAKVQKDDAKCNRCGKCYSICRFNAISKIEPDDYQLPSISMEKCTSCGDCFPVCDTKFAILRDINLAKIQQRNCRDCGKCFDFCRYDSILRV